MYFLYIIKPLLLNVSVYLYLIQVQIIKSIISTVNDDVSKGESKNVLLMVIIWTVIAIKFLFHPSLNSMTEDCCV